jgi:hypothetical protein
LTDWAYESACFNSATRGVIAGGTVFNKKIDFFTIATQETHKTLVIYFSRFGKGGLSSNTRGVIAGGGKSIHKYY